MSEINPTTTKERNSRKVLRNVMRAGALVTTAATFAAMGSPAAKADTLSPNSSKEAGKALLRDPHELPGLKTHLSQETLNRLKASTLEIAQRFSPKYGGSEQDSWSPSCTAVKVTLPGHKDPYIMTAAHCFRDLTGVTTGAFTDTLAPNDKAESFLTSSTFDYAVLDPSVSFNNRSTQPVATINQISISTNNKDVALLHPVASHLKSSNPFSIRKFTEIPSIPLSVIEKPLVQGTPVALYGEPQANNFEPISGTGVYLGRVSFNVSQVDKYGINKPAVYRELDLVGINPDMPQLDNCNYATSGSMFMTPDGKLSGNLSVRSSNGYGLDKKMQWPDSMEFDNYWRPVWEEELNVKLDGFGVICGYTVLDSKTPNELFTGFSNPVPVMGK